MKTVIEKVGEVGADVDFARLEDAVVAKVPFSELKAAGRWASDSSLKIYLDALMARAISSAPSVLRWRHLGVGLEQSFLSRA